MTFSPSVVTFILVIGLNSRYRRSSGPSGPEVVDGAVAEQLHRDQPGVRVDELAAHVREVGDRLAVEHPPVRVGDGLVHRVLADADGGGAEVELADVDGVERGVERGAAGVQHVLLAYRVVLEPELADVHLRVHDVLHQVVRGVPAVGGEEDVAVRPVDVGAAAEDRHEPGDVAVADVVLGAARQEAARGVRGEDHVGGVDVGAVAALGEPERHDVPVGEQPRRVCPGDRVGALPDRAEAEDGDLPGVPVAEAVEAEDLAQGRVAGGVPPLGGFVAVGRRGQERREQAFLGGEVQEVAVPGPVDVAAQELLLTAVLEEVDGGAQQPAGLGVEVRGIVGVRVEQQRVRHDGVPLPPGG
nr:hypothetical protein GCM10020092_066490 [Actinoplanes digitatis]